MRAGILRACDVRHSQFRMLRGCDVKKVRVNIRFIRLLEINFLLTAVLKIAMKVEMAESKFPRSYYYPELAVVKIVAF